MVLMYPTLEVLLIEMESEETNLGNRVAFRTESDLHPVLVFIGFHYACACFFSRSSLNMKNGATQ